MIDGIENKCPTDRNSQGTCKHVFLLGPPVPLFCPVGRKYQPILQDYWVKSVSKGGLKNCANPWPFSLFQPPNDPHGIQREDLILSLRAVLASTPRFAEVSLAKVRYVASAQRRLRRKDNKSVGKKKVSEYIFSVWHPASVFRLMWQVSSDLQSRNLYHLFV